MRTVELIGQVRILVEFGKKILLNLLGGDFPTAGSQVSSLGHGSKSSCHWFTASASPSRLHLNG